MQEILRAIVMQLTEVNTKSVIPGSDIAATF